MASDTISGFKPLSFFQDRSLDDAFQQVYAGKKLDAAGVEKLYAAVLDADRSGHALDVKPREIEGLKQILANANMDGQAKKMLKAIIHRFEPRTDKERIKLAETMSLAAYQREAPTTPKSVLAVKALGADQFDVAVGDKKDPSKATHYIWDGAAGSLEKVQAPVQLPPGTVVAEAESDSDVAALVFPDAKAKTASELIASGKVKLDPSHPATDALALALMPLSKAKGTASIDMGTLQPDWTTLLQQQLVATLMTSGGSNHVSLRASLTKQQFDGADDAQQEVSLRGFSVFDGDGLTSKGTYIETTHPEQTEISEADYVGRNDQGIQVRRNWREVWVVADASEDSTPICVAQRLFLRVDGQGNPVIGKNDFSATVPPMEIARALNPGMSDADLAVKSKDYVSGSYVFNGSVDDLEAKGGQLQEAAIVLDRSRSGSIGLSLGWTESPTNDSDSWTAHRTDFPKVLSEVMSNEGLGAVKISPSSLAALKARTAAALSNAQ